MMMMMNLNCGRWFLLTWTDLTGRRFLPIHSFNGIRVTTSESDRFCVNVSQEEEVEVEKEAAEDKKDPTHHSELDPKTMKVN